MPSTEVIVRAVRSYFAALRAMDREAWVNTFAADAVSHDPVGAPPIVGHQKLGDFFSSITSAFKEVGLTEQDIFIAGDGAAVLWKGKGTSRQGKPVRFSGIDVFEINEEGKIQTVRAYWNPGEMTAQL
ncbi:MAG TPA: nuclear transport factor 2 family protein [Pyrinomonadaceae bacterium]|jgi:steroid delta-isomerase